MSAKHKTRSNIGLNIVTSCISTTLVLVLIGIVVFFVSVAREFSRNLRENFTVTLMLDDETPNSAAYALQQQLRALPCAAFVN